jgi:hypothetical protein
MPPDSPRPSFRERAEQFDRQLLEFLETEIENTLGFARLAETEIGLGNREGAAAAMAKAKQGHDETLRWMDEARKRGLSIEHLGSHLEELVDALQSLRTRLEGQGYLPNCAGPGRGTRPDPAAARAGEYSDDGTLSWGQAV